MSTIACARLFYHPGVRMSQVPSVLPYTKAPSVIVSSAPSPFQREPDRESGHVDRYESRPQSALQDVARADFFVAGDAVNTEHKRDAAIEALKRRLDVARQSAREQRTQDAAEHFRAALLQLGRPSDIFTRTETAHHLLDLPQGDKCFFDLQCEALLGVASFADADSSGDILDDLAAMRPRIEAQKRAIAERIKHVQGFRAVRDDGTAKRLDDRGVAERMQTCEHDLQINEREVRRGEDQLRRFEMERERLTAELEPCKEHIQIACHRIDEAEKAINQLREDSDYIHGLGPYARAERKRLAHEIKQRADGLSFLKEDYRSLIGKVEPVRARLASNEEAIKDSRSTLSELYGSRKAVYIELDAIRAREEGDTGWTEVLESALSATESYLFRIRLQEAAAIMRHAVRMENLSTTGIGVGAMRNYSEAQSIAEDVLYDLHHMREDRHTRVRLFAQLMIIEALSRQAVVAHRSEDHAALTRIVDLLDKAVYSVVNEYEDGSLVWGREELVASHLADVAVLLKRMGIVDHALDHAHTITSLAAYADTPAAKRLFNTSDFSSYASSDGLSIMDARTVHELTPWWKRWSSRLQATLAHNHFKDAFKERLLGGGLGMGSTMAALYAATDDMQVVPAAGAAVTVNTALRLYHGWNTLQARSAYNVGGAGISARRTMSDAAGLALVRGAVGMAGWGFAAWMVATAAEPANRAWFADTFDNIGASYASVSGKLAGGVGSVDPLARLAAFSVPDAVQLYMAGGAVAYGAYAMMPHWRKALTRVLPWFVPAGLMTLSSITSPQDLYHLYMAGAGIVYGGYMFSPQMRASLQNHAKWFVPGAVMLGAHLGLCIKDQQAWSQVHLERLAMSSIGVGEGALMLLVTGAVPLSRVRSLGFERAMGRGIWHDANHMAMVGIAITVGVSAAMGGLMQKGDRPTDIPLIAYLGALTTIGLLPMTLGLSGVLKQQIPIVEHLRQARKDTEGWGFMDRSVELAKTAAQTFFLSMYTANRTIRSGTADVPWAALRTWVPGGYDSVAGYSAFVAGMGVTGNPATSKTFPEVGGTDWQLDPLTKQLTRHTIDQDKVLDHFKKSAQVMSPWHIWLYLGHRKKALKSMASPFTAIRYILNSPKFVLKRERHYLAQLYLYVTGQTTEPNHLSVDQLRSLLHSVGNMALNPDNAEVLHPIMQALYLARSYEGPPRKSPVTGSEVEDDKVSLHRKVIKEWFADNEALIKKFGLDPSTMRAVPPGTRRAQRVAVLKAVKESTEEYRRRVNAYLNADKPNLMADMFI